MPGRPGVNGHHADHGSGQKDRDPYHDPYHSYDYRTAPNYPRDTRDARDSPAYRTEPRDSGRHDASRQRPRDNYHDDPHSRGHVNHYSDEDPYNRSRLPPHDDHRGDPYRSHPERHTANGSQHRDEYYKTRAPDSDRRSDSHQYELDHLATFTVGSKQGLLSPEDGMKKLHQMEVSTGIWTMRVQLIVDGNDLLILDRSSGDEMERFDLGLVHEPTAVTNTDRSDVYNNVVLFTVMEDPNRQAPREMHIFQCIGRPAHDVVDDIKAGKSGRASRSYTPREDIVDGRGVPDRIRQYEEAAVVSAVATAQYKPGPAPTNMLRQSMHQEDNESVLSDRTDKEVQLLNHCFDDIERFVGRLQEAANAYKELDLRRKARNKKGKNKNKEHGDGMLTMRARPPPAKEFVDIFQKFKLALNLLAKLKAHIHDPNAPELVHFLFTPLSLVVESSKEPRHGAPELASKVVSPLLSSDAKELLNNCLTSKEHDLWVSLGDCWTISRDQWKGYVPPFYPKFSDGYQPASSLFEDGSQASMAAAVAAHSDFRHHSDEGESRSSDYHRKEDHRYNNPPYRDDRDRNPEPVRRIEDDKAKRDYGHDREPASAHYPPTSAKTKDYDDARESQPKPRMFEVLHDREGRNAKELTVKRGDVLELLDDTRKWWKMRNNRGQIGHVPYTILSPQGSGGEVVRLP